MSVRLGRNQYGKAETHLVRVYRDGAEHSLRDLLVSVALSGALDAVHLEGDNSAVLATDTQKNTVYAFAKESPSRDAGGVRAAARAALPGRGDLAGAGGGRRGRAGSGSARTRSRRRGASSGWRGRVCEADASWVVSGLSDLVVLKTTDSEFHGFPRDRYTTLAETSDRVLATAVSARWRHLRGRVVRRRAGGAG